MYQAGKFYIGGAWVEPVSEKRRAVINPASEETIALVAMGNVEDVNRAVAAARVAFDAYSLTTIPERIALLERVVNVYKKRQEEMAQIISQEMGAPLWLARGSHALQGIGHLNEILSVLKTFAFEERRAGSRVVQEPIGVCALITPWNWPMNQIACKVGPALAAGCTMVLKPSEVAPLNGHLFAEILHEAGIPAGVFNLVDGDGPLVGETLARHLDVDMISIIGSNRAGVAVAKAAADTVKRVTQELGGKSACIVLDDADAEAAAHAIVQRVMRNSGQSCAALTRLLVPSAMQDAAIAGARKAAQAIVVGGPCQETTLMGPVVSDAQYLRVQAYIAKGIEEGAMVASGGVGRPEHLAKGAFVKPTVFANVTPEMTIAREEVFGPVVCILPYRDEDDAVRIANSTIYGLSGAVRSADPARALRLARRLRTGMVHVNDTQPDYGAPFGGYRQSGNGREWGAYGLAEYLETKVIFGAMELP